MKEIIMTVKYVLNDKEQEEVARFPYKYGTRVDLPDVYPFNKNVYFGPDDGAFLGRIYIDNNGDLDYIKDRISLKDGMATYSPFKNDLYFFTFEVVDVL